MYDERNWFLSIGVNDSKPRRLGLQQSLVYIDGQPYLDRWIAHLLGWTLRVHKFYRGDDDRAPHTHPWFFITFPLSDYEEDVYDRGVFVRRNTVKAFRLHYRPAEYEHVVIGRRDGKPKPFYSLVLSGSNANSWGFYPVPGLFVYWRKFDEYFRSKQ